MNNAGLAAMRDYAIASGMIKNAPEQHAAPVLIDDPRQLYRPGAPFAPTDRTPLTDDEVRERAVGEGVFGWIMFDHGGELE